MRKLKFATLILAVLIVAGVGVRYLLDLRTLHTSCYTQYGDACPGEISQAVQGLVGQPLIFPRTNQANNLKTQFGQIQSIKLARLLPDTLAVTINVSKPILAVTNSGSPAVQEWYLIDSDHNLVGQSTNPVNLPRLTLGASHWQFARHQLVDTVAVKSIPFLVLLFEVMPPVSAQITPTNDLQLSLNNLSVFFSVDKDPAVSVATLQLALSDPTIQKNPPKSIDLRFANPVLSY